jgi:phosphohistidine phosphatase
MRHAKSSHEDVTIEDFDRPLNKRGEHDAPLMGRLMNQNGILLQEIISSPAERAIATTRLFCGGIEYPFQNVKLDSNLYLASASNLLVVIKSLNEKIESALLLGHNPGLTDLSNYLSESAIDNIPTGGIVELLYNRKSWQEIENGSFQMGFFEYPKKHYET